ncbi:prepilin-type N-terminal cleavage/methylation domain-containing protein [Clostridium sp. Sa3CUN1]|uniref:Prepilin-type N-terminal cleavage/methylation domain-containing protein n=1 Tax=Clostridium gallinarum TaxID=2762246 RepID=A0ABR8Q6E2_9CLOT|nr:prepilin-type N-terminal cleavage/methylation domain-containing protein [Clostridium gallinarum]MBD7915998.1 prepilin-type N-terminal cleavage/methylation domain-containing protein [Clostridium gallinarum]
MISIMELMEKKILLTKKNSNKKGMTLVEIMAAMAILSILFIGISSFIIGIVNSEAKTNRKLESDGYLKNALLMFESGVVSPGDSLNFTVSFDNIEQMKTGIETLQNTNEGNGIYKITITTNLEGENNLYKVEATFKNSRNEEYSKHIYVLRRD